MTSDEAHRRRYAEAIRHARELGADSFQDWFDRSPGEEESIRRGYWDFALHVLTPAVCERLSSPGSLTALEIGYGGGRLLNAAATFFGHAIGVDVHEEEATVRALLDRLGRGNTTLLRGSGSDLPVDSGSVDLVYSFIVLQHLPRYDALVSYVGEAFRVLRRGGLAQLYYGRLPGRLPGSGFREIDAAPNQMSLLVSARRARRVCRDAGFRVVDTGVSYKRVPDGYRRVVGGQAYVTLVKP